MDYRAPFTLKGCVLRFCVGASFVTVTVCIGRGESVVSFLRCLFAQEKFPSSLVGSAFCTLRLLYDEIPFVSEDVDVAHCKSDLRLLSSVASEFAAAAALVVSSVGKVHLEELEKTFRAARQDIYSAREEQTRILQDSHSLVMSQVALRGDEPSEDLLADQKLQMSILEGKYVRELEGLAEAQRREFQEFVMRFAAIERETPVSQLLSLAREEKKDSIERARVLTEEQNVQILTSFHLLMHDSLVRKVSCVECCTVDFASAVLDLVSNSALIIAADVLAGSKTEKAFCEGADEQPELMYETCSQQVRRCRAEITDLQEGDVFLTKHSNMPSCRLALHLVSSVPSEPPSLAQMRAKTRLLVASLRRCLVLCVALSFDIVSVPLAFDAEERAVPGQGDDAAFAERVDALVAVVAEFLTHFRHVRFYIPPKLPQQIETVRIIRSLKTKPNL
jgi:hypothetical protein